MVAAAGAYVLLRPERGVATPDGPCSLTYLDGRIPMGWDGTVETAAHPSELRFRVGDTGRVADRRSSVRIPVEAPVQLAVGGPVGAGEPVGDGRLIDISAGGMRLRRRGRIATGTTVQVHTEIPGGPVIDADAVVRASEPGICSLEFATMRASSVQEVGAWTIDVLRSSLAIA